MIVKHTKQESPKIGWRKGPGTVTNSTRAVHKRNHTAWSSISYGNACAIPIEYTYMNAMQRIGRNAPKKVSYWLAILKESGQEFEAQRRAARPRNGLRGTYSKFI